jgi:hypothetical protein
MTCSNDSYDPIVHSAGELMPLADNATLINQDSVHMAVSHNIHGLPRIRRRSLEMGLLQAREAAL